MSQVEYLRVCPRCGARQVKQEIKGSWRCYACGANSLHPSGILGRRKDATLKAQHKQG